MGIMHVIMSRPWRDSGPTDAIHHSAATMGNRWASHVFARVGGSRWPACPCLCDIRAAGMKQAQRGLHQFPLPFAAYYSRTLQNCGRWSGPSEHTHTIFRCVCTNTHSTESSMSLTAEHIIPTFTRTVHGVTSGSHVTQSNTGLSFAVRPHQGNCAIRCRHGNMRS